MTDFHSQVAAHLISSAKDDDHRRLIHRLLPGFKNLFAVMAGTQALPIAPPDLPGAFARCVQTLNHEDAAQFRGVQVRPVKLSELGTIPGERNAYEAIMLSLLVEDIIFVTSLHGRDLMNETNAFVVNETRKAVPQLFGLFAAAAVRHFDRALLGELMFGYPIVSTMAIVAMLERDAATARSILPKAELLAQGLPVGIPKDDPKSFIILCNG